MKKRLLNSKLLKDSFWAVFGNGLGNFLLLVAGIIIARILGKDLYGEYGMVKTTMFHIASFSTLGLGLTSTKYIADSVSNARGCIQRIIRTSLQTTILFSLFLCVVLCVFAQHLANYIEEPQTAPAFRALGIIVVFRAVNTISIGILAGYKSFKSIGINSVISGLIMLFLASSLTYKFGLIGSFLALSISQLANAVLNICVVIRHYKEAEKEDTKEKLAKDMLMFTIPVAIQEFFYMIAMWGSTMILTKYASLGEVGLCSAASQWVAIISFIPHLLINVVLSYLSGAFNEKNNHVRMLKKMLGINLICSFLPFLIVFVLADFIASFYGETFIGLSNIIRVITFSTVLSCLSNVFHSSLLAEGRNWLLLAFRAIRDMIMIIALWIVLKDGKESAALAYAWIYVIINVIYFIMMASSEIVFHKRHRNL